MFRTLYNAGIYGKSPKFQIIELETGESVSFEGHEAFKLHTEIMSVPRGEERQEKVREIYERESGRHVSTNP